MKFYDPIDLFLGPYKAAIMKNKYSFLLLISIMLFICSRVNSQSGKVPPFQIMLYNGKIFKAQNLPLEKSIIIMYFSPECEECQQFTEELITRMDDFQNASIAMITYLPVEKVKQFVSLNRLDKYSNIFVGTEGNSLFVRNYFNILQFPFVALYNKDGVLIKRYYSTEINLIDLINRLKGF